MALRPARFVDVPALVDLLVEQHPRSIYRDICEVDTGYARKLLAQMVQRHGHVHNGGACVFVDEDADSTILAFVAGQLSPVYHIGTRLMAQDVFLVAHPDSPGRSLLRLVHAYDGWALANPKVVEVYLSHLDTFPESSRMDPIFQHLGYERCGAIFRRFSAHAKVVEQAA